MELSRSLANQTGKQTISFTVRKFMKGQVKISWQTNHFLYCEKVYERSGKNVLANKPFPLL